MKPSPHWITFALSGFLALALNGCSKTADIPPASSQPASVGNSIDDTLVTTRVRTALMANEKIHSGDFKVETLKGEVMLSGFADNQAQIDQATVIVLAVEGVKSVQNNVAIKTAQATVGNKVDGGLITGKVKAALLADPRIRSLDIHVVTRIDEVQLSGFVDTQAQVDLAMQLATATAGVHRVTNAMKLKP